MEKFSLLHSVQTGSSTPLSFLSVGIGYNFSECKTAGRDHSLPYRAEFKNMWSYTSTPPNIFNTRCLINPLNSNDYYIHHLLFFPFALQPLWAVAAFVFLVS
jgi:hypothetical protein